MCLIWFPQAISSTSTNKVSYIFGLSFHYLNNIPGPGDNFHLGLEPFALEINLFLSVILILCDLYLPLNFVFLFNKLVLPEDECWECDIGARAIGDLNFGPRTLLGARQMDNLNAGTGVGWGTEVGRLDLQYRGIKHSLT